MTTLNINDIGSQRKSKYATSNGYGTNGTLLGHTPSQAQSLRAHQYLPTGNMNPAMMHHAHADGSLAALTHGFGGMSLQSNSFGSTASNRSQMSAGSSEFGGVPLSSQGQALYLPQQQQVVFAGNHLVQSGHGHNGLPHNGIYTPMGYHMHHGNFQAYHQQQMGDQSPLSQGWTSRMPSGEMPTLVTPRRDSISSNEQDLPGTPYTAYNGYQNGGVTVMDRSPTGVFTHSASPSPSQLVHPYGIQVKAPILAPSAISAELEALVRQEPAIPEAIPAPSSPMKPLDRSLENKNGETNVYIRGLLPETTDDMLYSWGARFGDIQSSKSIIDLKTSQCKGFGFIKYHNFEDAEKCIRGFHSLGYEVSFARESFYAKLKKFSDETNTNLYVSNIPRNMNEHELSAVFAPHKVCSARILRDSNGVGRGVGFARFDTRDTCEEVIKQFNNTTISKPNGEDHTIQIRYSDTHEQKVLKQQTAAARSFRAAEFEFGCNVARSQGMHSQEYLPLLSPSDPNHDAANEFEKFLNNANSQAPRVPVPGFTHMNNMRFTNPVVTPITTSRAHTAALSTEHTAAQPIPQVNLPGMVTVESDSSTFDKEDSKHQAAKPVIAHGDHSSPTSATHSEQE